MRVDVRCQPTRARVLFYEHHTVTAFDFGKLVIANEVHVLSHRATCCGATVRNLVGTDPQRSIDGVGDITDTNDVFRRAATDPTRSPLCHAIDVAVVATAASIDTTVSDVDRKDDSGSSLA